MHGLNAKLKGRRETLGEANDESDAGNEVEPLRQLKQSLECLASDQFASRTAVGVATEALDVDTTDDEDILDSIGHVASLERVASRQIVTSMNDRFGAADQGQTDQQGQDAVEKSDSLHRLESRQMVTSWDETFLDDEKLPMPPRVSLVHLGSRQLVKNGIARSQSVDPSSDTSSVLGHYRRRPRMLESPHDNGMEKLHSDATACPGTDGPGCFPGDSPTECAGYVSQAVQLFSPTQNISSLTEHVDSVSLLAAAALRRQQHEGLSATRSPGSLDSTSQLDTELPSALRCSTSMRSSRRSRGSRVSWHDLEFPEKSGETAGSSQPSDARRTKQTEAQPAQPVQDVREPVDVGHPAQLVEEWTIYRQIKTVATSLGDLSNVIQCCCSGIRAQPPFEGCTDGAFHSRTPGSHSHMEANGGPEVCVPTTPVGARPMLQLDRVSSNRWFECFSTQTTLERASSAPPCLAASASSSCSSLITSRGRGNCQAGLSIAAAMSRTQTTVAG